MAVCVCAPVCECLFASAFILDIKAFHRDCSVCVFRDLPINSCIEFHSCMAVPNLFNQPPEDKRYFYSFCITKF